jgi:hypothetical protein
MNRLTVVVLGLFAMTLAGCATEYSVSPLADLAQQVHYWHGKPTIYSETRLGAVQVTPLGVNDDDRVGFAVAVFNKSGAPVNFGIENLEVAQQNGAPGKIFTSMELQHEAKVHAAWAEFGILLLGATDAALASRSAYSTTRTKVRTSYGNASIITRAYDPAAAYAAGRDAGIVTGAGIAVIQSSLDNTLAMIDQHVLQTTTVDPGQSDGGIAVVDTLSSEQFPQDVTLHVNLVGEDHVFRFSVARGVDQIVRQASAPVTPTATAAATTIPNTPYVPAPIAASALQQQEPAVVSFAEWKGGNTKHKSPARVQHAVLEGAVGPAD